MKTDLEILHQSRVVQLLTYDELDNRVARWMTMYRRESSPENEFWFATSAYSRKIAHIEKNPQVVLVALHPDQRKELLFEGKAEIVNDKSIKEELWVPSWDMFFPRGVESQDLVLLKITIE
jgi:general stress protein 26